MLYMTDHNPSSNFPMLLRISTDGASDYLGLTETILDIDSEWSC